MNGEVPDLLADAARLSRQWAGQLCCKAGPDGPGCEPYHAAWTTLRQLGSITGAKTDEDFYLQRLGAVASRLERPRVLICGTADHAMLEMALRACRRVGREPVVTVVDACRTTLELNRWYGEQVSASVTIVNEDVRTFEQAEAFDLVCTHSILSFVPEPDHVALLGCWRRSLSKDGRLVQVQGVRPDLAGTAVLRLGALEVQRFVDRVGEDHRRSTETVDLSAPQVETLARGFARHKSLLVVSDAERIRQSLLAAGFAIDEFDQLSRHGLTYRSSNADRSDQAFSLRIVASASPSVAA